MATHDINTSVRLAFKRGYFPLRASTPGLRDEPAWLTELQQPGGFAKLQKRLGCTVPSILRDFWSQPDLVRLLDSWRRNDYLAEPPQIVHWRSQPYLLFCSHPHSGSVAAVHLDQGDDPTYLVGFQDNDTPLEEETMKISQHVRISIQYGPDRQELD